VAAGGEIRTPLPKIQRSGVGEREGMEGDGGITPRNGRNDANLIKPRSHVAPFGRSRYRNARR